MISARVNVVSGWGERYAKRINAQVRDAVEDAAEVGADVSAGIAASRSRTGRMARMETVPVRGTPTGWEGGWRSAAWYAHFQSGGTVRGVTALKFFEAGRTAARKHLKARLDRL